MRKLGIIALATVLAGGLPAIPATAQSAPEVRTAPDFAGIVSEYREKRARDAGSCCAFSAPVLDRTLAFWLFDSFEPVYEARNDRQLILEFVPQGATVENWPRMITLSAFKGAGSAPVSTADMQQRFFNTAKGCEVANFSRVIASGRLNDGTEYNLSSNGCGSTAAGGYPGARSGRGEQFIALLLRDDQNIVVLQYAERGERFAEGEPPIRDDMVAAVMSRFRSIAFCRDKTATGDCSIAFGPP